MCSGPSIVFTAGVQNISGSDPLVFLRLTVADSKRDSRMKNQSASIDASGPAGFFYRQRTPQEKKAGGLGLNKRNRGYPADFEFIERPLSSHSILGTVLKTPLATTEK